MEYKQIKDPTTKDFIENINFDYFETYSFQRKGDFEIYENLFNKYNLSNDSLSKEEETELKELRRKLSLYTQKNNFIFTDKEKLNDTAELVFKSDKLANLNKELIKIMKIPFIDCDDWMCAPIYRDAILFYDNNDQLINGINICFKCNNVIDLNRKDILTDRVVYEKLKLFLQSVGHKIN